MTLCMLGYVVLVRLHYVEVKSV